MNDKSIDAVAVALEIERQVGAREKRAALEFGFEPTISQAYDAQDAYVQLLQAAGHGDVVGHKIALTTPAMQKMVGVDHPLAGKLLSSAIHRVSASQSYALKLSNHQKVGVEFEVAVRLGAALSGNVTRAQVADAVDAVMPAFELVEDRDADYQALEPFGLIAENAWNAGNVLGDPVTDIAGIDFETARTSLEINGEAAGEAVTGDAMGHPFDVIVWICALLGERGQGIEAGQIVMTGSSITTRFPVAGDHYRFQIQGLGELSLDAS